MMDLFAEPFRRRLARLFEAVALPVEKPAVVETTETAVLYPSVAQVGTPVGAMKTEQSEITVVVAKQDEILAQDSNRHRRAIGRQLFEQGYRLPVSPEQITARSAGSGAGQQIVIFLRQHLTILDL
jgi:hypothetical protein